MDKVEKLMETRKWQSRCLRSNIVNPDDIVIYKKTKLAIATNNTTSKLIGYTVAHQALTQKIRFDEEAFLADFTSTRSQSQFNHL